MALRPRHICQPAVKKPLTIEGYLKIISRLLALIAILLFILVFMPWY